MRNSDRVPPGLLRLAIIRHEGGCAQPGIQIAGALDELAYDDTTPEDSRVLKQAAAILRKQCGVVLDDQVLPNPSAVDVSDNAASDTEPFPELAIT